MNRFTSLQDRLGGQPEPPGWAQRLLRWYCRPDIVEDLQGDLNEYFERNVKTSGIRRARLIYCLDVLKFFRLYTVRKPDWITLIIHWIMIGSYIKTSGRSLMRNKLFSFINIFGLAVSMSVGLLVIAFLTDLLSYDDFHAKKNRIYRLVTRDESVGQPVMNFASSSIKAGREIQKSVTGIEDITLLRREFSGDAIVNDKTVIPLKALWADPSFFRVFSFPLLQGDPATVLKEPYSLVLTEKMANKLFGETEALGKKVRFDTLTYTVTGVVQDIPKLSHLRFEALVSFATIAQKKADMDGELISWENIYSNYTYLVLPETVHLSVIQANLERLSATENALLKNRKITLSLQPLSDIALGAHYANEIGGNIPPLLAWILGGLALVVILSACFNYTNLSLARSLRRSREVGIRKVIGALKGHVLVQFLAESIIIALLALMFSFLLFLFLRTEFIALNPFIENLVSLELSVKVVVYFIGLAVAVGLAAGFLPALFFSQLNAVIVLKDASSLPIFRRISLRKALIVSQYTLSIIFIATTLIGYSQYRGFLSFDLGFTTENILNIRMQGNKSELLRKELAEIPAVREISRSHIITSLGSLSGTTMKYKDPQDSARVWLNFVDERHLPLHGHKFLAGKNLTRRPSREAEAEVVVNEQLLKRFNIAHRNPAEALGERVEMDGLKLVIVGVLRDFHYGTVEDKIEPMAFRYFTEESGGYLNVKIYSTDLPATMASIDNAWRKIDPVHPLDAHFYDDQIEQAYSRFSMILKVIGFIAFLAICISSLGLFGMVIFTTETRLKEIGIRKVMGASEAGLIYLLSKGFLQLLLIATLVALPVTYFFFDKVVLVNFAYHQPLGLSELLIGVVFVMLLALVLICSQTLKAARKNPVLSLKAD